MQRQMESLEQTARRVGLVLYVLAPTLAFLFLAQAMREFEHASTRSQIFQAVCATMMGPSFCVMLGALGAQLRKAARSATIPGTQAT